MHQNRLSSWTETGLKEYSTCKQSIILFLSTLTNTILEDDIMCILKVFYREILVWKLKVLYQEILIVYNDRRTPSKSGVSSWSGNSIGMSFFLGRFKKRKLSIKSNAKEIVVHYLISLARNNSFYERLYVTSLTNYSACTSYRWAINLQQIEIC